MKALDWVLVLVIAGVAVILLFRERDPPPLDPKMRAEVERSQAERSAILFIGSSTIDRFPLSECFPGKRCVNLGRGNENSLLLRERLKTALPFIWPAGIV